MAIANDQIDQRIGSVVLTNQFKFGLQDNRLTQFYRIVLLRAVAGRMHALHLRDGDMEAC